MKKLAATAEIARAGRVFKGELRAAGDFLCHKQLHVGQCENRGSSLQVPLVSTLAPGVTTVCTCVSAAATRTPANVERDMCWTRMRRRAHVGNCRRSHGPGFIAGSEIHAAFVRIFYLFIYFSCSQVWTHARRGIIPVSTSASATETRLSASVEWDSCWTRTRNHAHVRIRESFVCCFVCFFNTWTYWFLPALSSKETMKQVSSAGQVPLQPFSGVEEIWKVE